MLLVLMIHFCRSDALTRQYRYNCISESRTDWEQEQQCNIHYQNSVILQYSDGTNRCAGLKVKGG